MHTRQRNSPSGSRTERFARSRHGERSRRSWDTGELDEAVVEVPFDGVVGVAVVVGDRLSEGEGETMLNRWLNTACRWALSRSSLAEPPDTSGVGKWSNVLNGNDDKR